MKLSRRPVNRNFKPKAEILVETPRHFLREQKPVRDDDKTCAVVVQDVHNVENNLSRKVAPFFGRHQRLAVGALAD